MKVFANQKQIKVNSRFISYKKKNRNVTHSIHNEFVYKTKQKINALEVMYHSYV